MRFLTPVLLSFFGAVTFVLATSPGREAIDLIAKRVEPFELGQAVPGVLKIETSSARELLLNGQGKIFAALGYTTDGRVVAYAHDVFLTSELLTQPGARTLLSNTIRWAGKSSSPSVGLTSNLALLEPLLEEQGMPVRILKPEDLVNQVDVFVFVGQDKLSKEALEAVRRFALKGGGVVTAATPWPFGRQYPDFSAFPANQVANLAGIAFQPGDYAAMKGAVVSVPESFEESDPVAAAKKLLEAKTGDAALAATLRRGTSLYGKCLDEFLTLMPQVNRALGPIIPTAEKPLVPGQNPLIDAVVDLEDEFNQTLPAEKLWAIPAAADYPGLPGKDAPRVSRTVTLNADYKGWISGRPAGHDSAKEARPTGLYAAPGEVIHVTVPQTVAGQELEVSIGAYGGGLAKRDKWTRYPRLQRQFPVDSVETKAANGFGGLIQILIPQGAKLGEIQVKIDNAVEAPLYVLGQTTLPEWKSAIRLRPAPWAELASERMIIALPSEYIRKLDNPDELMAVWNSIIDTAAELAMVDRKLYRAERLVFDRQTSAGFMHSGYPVAAHLGDSARNAVDADALKRYGNWGFFHEYGHNHQHDLWALPGTVETTCNLWSAYLFEKLVGKDPKEAHDEMRPLRRQQRMNAYFKNGRKFEEEWNVWTALDSYLLLQEAFGWEPYQKVFQGYNQLPSDAWPRTQQEKNDQWVIRFSKACGHNLAPYYQAWNLPLSDSVAEELSSLPEWKENPVSRYLK